MKFLKFRNSSFFVKIDHFWTLIRKMDFSRYTNVQRGFIYDQKDLENTFIKSESLFDPFLVPITTFFENLAYFGLFSTGFAFRFHGARAQRQHTQNDGKEHLHPNMNSYCHWNQFLKHFRAKNDKMGNLAVYNTWGPPHHVFHRFEDILTKFKGKWPRL